MLAAPRNCVNLIIAAGGPAWGLDFSMTSHSLPPRLVLGTARAFRASLLECVGRAPVVLDGSAVEAVDTAGLQVLLAAARTARARGGELVLERCSPTLRRVLELTGLSERLQPIEGHAP